MSDPVYLVSEDDTLVPMRRRSTSMRLICRGSLRAIWNSWGKGKHSRYFYPLLSTPGKNYQVFAVLTNGKIEIEYKFLKNYPPFTDEKDASRVLPYAQRDPWCSGT